MCTRRHCFRIAERSSQTAGKYATSPSIIGANMAFRKTVLEATSGFDPLLGPGTICKAVEDLDIIYRSLKNKFKIVYSPEVMVFHNHGRRTELDENQTSFAYGLRTRGILCQVYSAVGLSHCQDCFQGTIWPHQDIDEKSNYPNKISIPSTDAPGTFPRGILLLSGSIFLETVSADAHGREDSRSLAMSTGCWRHCGR